MLCTDLIILTDNGVSFQLGEKKSIDYRKKIWKIIFRKSYFKHRCWIFYRYSINISNSGYKFWYFSKMFQECSCIHLNLRLCKDWNQLQPYFFYLCCAGFTRFSPHKQLSTFWIPLRCYTSTPTSGIFHSLISSCEYIMVCKLTLINGWLAITVLCTGKHFIWNVFNYM